MKAQQLREAAVAEIRRAAEEVIAEAVDSARGQIVAEVLALHAPFKIYDECEHDHTDKEVREGRAVYIEDLGYTCESALMYVICRECCTNGDEDDRYQTEECNDYHEHAADGSKPRCPTAALVASFAGGAS